MKKILSLLAVAIAIAVLPLVVGARTQKFTKDVNPHRIVEEVRAAGYGVKTVNCRGSECRFVFEGSEVRDVPQALIDAHVKINLAQQRRDAAVRAKELVTKLRAGQITGPEKDELLDKLAAVLGL